VEIALGCIAPLQNGFGRAVPSLRDDLIGRLLCSEIRKQRIELFHLCMGLLLQVDLLKILKETFTIFKDLLLFIPAEQLLDALILWLKI